MLRRITTIAAWRYRNHYRNDMALRIEMAARLGDNRKLFRLHKATKIRRMVCEMIRDNNGMPVEAIKDRLVKWDFLRQNLTVMRRLLFIADPLAVPISL